MVRVKGTGVHIQMLIHITVTMHMGLVKCAERKRKCFSWKIKGMEKKKKKGVTLVK